jgi:hypothetical protein
MAIRSLIIAILSICVASAQQKNLPQSTVPDDVTGVLTLSDGSKFATALYNMKIIGQLRTAKKIPYFILSGTTCTECDENISIYIHSPSDGPMKDEATQPRFSYPGREKDYETGKLVYDAKVFFGDCLASRTNAVIWFEHWSGDDKKWHSSISVAEVKNDNLAVSKLDGASVKLSDVQAAVRNGKCWEIPGVDRSSEP